MKNKIFLLVIVVFSICSVASAQELEDYVKTQYENFLKTVDTNALSTDEIMELFTNSLKSDSSAILEMSKERNWDEQFGTLYAKQGTIDTIIIPINCDNNANSVLKIIWQNGLPRTGVLNNCMGDISNISYFANNINPPMNIINSPLPKISDSAFRYANSIDCNLKVIDVTTGTLVKEFPLQAVTPFKSSKLPNLPDSISIKHDSFSPDSYHNVSLAALTKGLYFITILTPANEVIYIKTWRKEI